MNLGITNAVDHPVGVLGLGTSLIAFLMDASNGDVETGEVFVIKIQMSLGVKNVNFTPHQNTDAVHLTGNNKHVTEIDDGTGTLDAGTMFGDTQHLQSLVGCCLRHFLQTAVCMS